MAGVKGKSGRKPNLKDTDNKNLDRADRAIRAQENNDGIKKIGSPPSRLSKFAKKLWKSVVSELADTNLLTVLDSSLLEEYVTQVDLSVQADELIEEYGLVTPDQNGVLKKNPAVDIKNNAAKNIKSIGSSLGLDPMSRAAMLADVEPEDDGSADDEINRFKGGV